MQQSKQAKYCFNLPNNVYIMCFNKFTGEHNANKILLKNFVLWEYIFKKQEYLLQLFVQYMETQV